MWSNMSRSLRGLLIHYDIQLLNNLHHIRKQDLPTIITSNFICCISCLMFAQFIPWGYLIAANTRYFQDKFIVSLFIKIFRSTRVQEKRWGHPNKMFRFPSPDRPIFFRKVKKKNSRFTGQRSKYFDLQAHDLVLITIGMIWCPCL